MKQKELEEIKRRASVRKDGVYSYKSYSYLVRDGRVVAFCDYSGALFQIAHGFVVCSGKAEDRFEGRKRLKGIVSTTHYL